MATWVKKLDAVTLFVEDLAEAKAVYQRVFDLPVGFSNGDLAVLRPKGQVERKWSMLGHGGGTAAEARTASPAKRGSSMGGQGVAGAKLPATEPCKVGAYLLSRRP